MSHAATWLAAAFAVGTVSGAGTTTSTAPSTQPATAPRATQPAVSKEIEAVLDKLEKKRREIKDLQADLTYQHLDVIAEAKRTQIGWLRYRAETAKSPARFMVHFHTQSYDEHMIKRKEWFCFDGKTFREVREHTKTVLDRRLAETKERIDPFELGRGPFPMPFGQRKSEMIKNFDMALSKPTKKKDAGADLLKLVPKKGSRLAKAYAWVEFLLDRKTLLPRRIVTEHRDENVTTVWFSKVKTNIGIKDKGLWIEKPRYEHIVEVD